MITISPVAKKLLIKPGTQWLFYNAPDNYLATLEPLPEGTEPHFSPGGDFTGIQLFVRNSADLATNLKTVMPLLKPETVFWISYPKKSSGIKSDLEMMSSWDEVGKYGYTGVAAAAIDETWTALRFKPVELTKASGSRNEEIKKNDYANYIDVDNKQVKLPPEVEAVLTPNAVAMDFYQKLSYSNKKEYVIWILSAKQEKTKQERLEKMVEKLAAGKKNPAEK
ncbi:MAG TPA: YdeI/OmpD-associated family protein [Mucilaginibacter sp.]